MGLFKKITEKLGELIEGDSAKNQEKKDLNAQTEDTIVESNKTTGEKTTNVEVEHPRNDAKSPNTEVKKPLPNSVEIREKIKKNTLATLDSLYLTNPDSCKTKHLNVWLDTDNSTFKAYSDLGQELENYWSVERGYMFGKVELKQGKPADEKDAKKIEYGFDSISIYLEDHEESQTPEAVVKKARISIAGGKGSMLKKQYELSSDTLKAEHRKYYNIGRGEYPNMSDGSFRQNHIAIDDNKNLEINGHVSRAHARIGFSENVGFYLQVELGGTRLVDNRTRIFRNEDKIEVDNIAAKEPLRDGDLIELGKAVLLKFNEIN